MSVEWIKRFRLAFACMLAWPCCITANQAQAILFESDYFSEDLLFPRPDPVQKQVTFWTAVFQKHPSTSVLIHDAQDLNKIIDIIDFTKIKKGQKFSKKKQDRLIRSYLKRYRKAIANIKQYQHKATALGDMEKRLFHTYNDSPADLKRLFAGDIAIRGQGGLADTFIEAAKRARKYLPEMERIFSSYGLPIKLTRLVFVESMFRSDALSKVGASGMWQFMPATAAKFLYVGKNVDERNSPFKATRAAAQLLSENFHELRSWPLAVTAYNHGREGMKRASQTVATVDIGTIIENYSSKSFGFASRNFYSELLAASDTYQKLLTNEPALFTINPLAVQSVILKDPISVDTIVAKTNLTISELKQLNPCIAGRMFEKMKSQKLPEFYEIYVPTEKQPELAQALRLLEATKIARR